MHQKIPLIFLILFFVTNLQASEVTPNITMEDGWLLVRSECQAYTITLYGDRKCSYRSGWNLTVGESGLFCIKGNYCAFFRYYNPGAQCDVEKTLTLCPSTNSDEPGTDFKPYIWYPYGTSDLLQQELRRRAGGIFDCYYKVLSGKDDYILKCKLKD